MAGVYKGGLSLQRGQHRNLVLGESLLPQEDVLLVEVTEEALADAVNGRACLKSLGGPTDPLVFCTSSTTYQAKHVETTNLLMLCDTSLEHTVQSRHCADGHENSEEGASTGLLTQVQAGLKAADEAPVDVVAITNFTVETQKMDPPLAQLSRMLREHRHPPLSAPAEESGREEAHAAGISWPELQQQVLASDLEIAEALQRLKALAVKRDGELRWHACDAEFYAGALDTLVLTCVQNDLRLTAFQPGELLTCLSQSGDSFTAELLASDAALLWYVLRTACRCNGECLPLVQRDVVGEPRVEPLPSDGVVSFDRMAVVQQCARKLLLQAPEQPWKLFCAAWVDAVPANRHWQLADDGGGSFTVETLRGIALVERRGGEQVVIRLFADDLPLEAPARFEALFAARAYWSFPDIAPYLENVYDDGDTGKALLTRYSRSSQNTPQEQLLYSMR